MHASQHGNSLSVTARVKHNTNSKSNITILGCRKEWHKIYINMFLYEIYELLSKYGNKGFNGFLYHCSNKQHRHFADIKMSFTSIRVVIIIFTITLKV